MTKKIKVVLTCFKQTSYEDYTHFFKTVEIEVPCQEGEDWHVCGEEYQELSSQLKEKRYGAKFMTNTEESGTD